MLRIIVASTKQGGIGLQGALPWVHNPSDMAYFRKMTVGNTCYIGRKTYQSIPGGLKDRDVRVVTRDRSYLPQYGGELAPFILKDLDGWVLGGAEIYDLLLPQVSEVHRTLIHGDWEADTFWHVPTDWKLCTRSQGTGCEFQVWRRPRG